MYRGIISFQEVPTLQVDNSAAVKLSYNPELHRRTKHIAVKHFFIREKVLEGELDHRKTGIDSRANCRHNDKATVFRTFKVFIQ